jgi:hypothetical protein
MADEVVPRLFTEFVYDCPEEEDDEDYKFLEHIRNPKKVVIKNICGTEAHLKRLTAIGERFIEPIEYLYIEVDGDETDKESDELARKYMEMYRKYFGDIRVLRIDTTDDSNFTRMIKMMMNDPTFPWFDKVHTIKVY